MARLKMRVVVEGGAFRMGMTNERAEMPRGTHLGGDPVFTSNCTGYVNATNADA